MDNEVTFRFNGVWITMTNHPDGEDTTYALCTGEREQDVRDALTWLAPSTHRHTGQTNAAAPLHTRGRRVRPLVGVASAGQRALSTPTYARVCHFS